MVGGVALQPAARHRAAWLVERTDLPGRRVWHVLLVAPLAVPAFVNSYGWVSMTPAVQGYGGALLVVTLSYFPLVYLPVAAVLRGLDPALEETALASGWARGDLPPGDAAAAAARPARRRLLVALHLLAEFGALRCCASRPSPPRSTTSTSSTFNGPAPRCWPACSSLLCLVLLLAELRLARPRGATRGSAAAPPGRPPAAPARPARVPALAAGSRSSGWRWACPLASLVYWLPPAPPPRSPSATCVSTTGPRSASALAPRR